MTPLSLAKEMATGVGRFCFSKQAHAMLIDALCVAAAVEQDLKLSPTKVAAICAVSIMTRAASLRAQVGEGM